MSYKISMENLGEIITIDNKQNKKVNNFAYSDKICSSNFEELILSNDIAVIKWELETKENLEIFGSYKTDSLCISIGLNGNIKLSEENSKTEMNLVKNEIFSTYRNNIKGKEFYEKNIKHKILNIYLKNNFVQKYMPNSSVNLEKQIKQTDFFKILNHKKSHHQSIAYANNIFNSPFESGLNELFIYGNVLELLSCELNDLLNLNQKQPNKRIKFNDYDLDALEKARVILLDNLEHAPSIAELSKSVKLNEFKLKYGFKKIFHTTPYGLLLDYRMTKAHTLLKSSDYNVNEISSLVGYKQSSNFTKAFYKKYSVLPKDIMKNRQYYY